jgi:hypothetical protein
MPAALIVCRVMSTAFTRLTFRHHGAALIVGRVMSTAFKRLAIRHHARDAHRAPRYEYGLKAAGKSAKPTRIVKRFFRSRSVPLVIIVPYRQPRERGTQNAVHSQRKGVLA